MKKYPRSGPDLHLDRKRIAEKQNISVMSDPHFKRACNLAEVEPSKRQARKWRAKRGAAWQVRNDV